MEVKSLTVALIWLALACGSEPPNPSEGADPTAGNERTSMTVFCGSASKPAMTEIARSFQEETGVEVNLIFGGSGTLLSQISLSKKGEIYLPGSPDYISIGLRKKLLIEGSDKKVAYLVPAIITPKGNPARIEKLSDLARPGVKVGIGNPKSVCLGLYSVELLEKAGLTSSVLQNVVTFGGSCSKTANLASLGQVDGILGWRVFAAWNPERMQAVPIEKEVIPRISYIPIAIPVHTKDRSLSQRFIGYVVSKKGRDVYERFGYIVDEQSARAFAPNAGIGGEYTLPGNYFEWQKSVGKNQ